LPAAARSSAAAVQRARSGRGHQRDHGIFDGTGAFPGEGGTTILIRNHENRERAGELKVMTPPALQYDAEMFGGNTKLEIRREKAGSDPVTGQQLYTYEVVRDFAILGGTSTNCAGGLRSPHQWLACEEVVKRGASGKKHGYIFEIDARADGPVAAIPIPQLGRRSHEAALESAGVIYMTEDRNRVPDPVRGQIGAAFYRYLPTPRGGGVPLVKTRGALEALAVRGRPNMDLDLTAEVGVPYPVEWVRIPEPDHEDDTDERRDRVRGFTPNRVQAADAGAAIFDRQEGMWAGPGEAKVYFDCTSGGRANLGQVWEYDPGRETITPRTSSSARTPRASSSSAASRRTGRSTTSRRRRRIRRSLPARRSILTDRRCTSTSRESAAGFPTARLTSVPSPTRSTARSSSASATTRRTSATVGELGQGSASRARRGRRARSSPYRGPAMAKVLIVEDDEIIAQGISRHLEGSGWSPVWIADGRQALSRLRFEQPDVVVLDLMLPGLDGWAFIETARAEGIGTPIVVVSARGTEHDRVHALEIGADDYLVKPFSMKELVARVRAAGRRGAQPAEVKRGEAIELEELRIDPREVQAYVDGESAELTPTEFRLLYTLALEPGRVATRDELLQKIWGRRELHRDRTVDVFVGRLRDKIDRRAPRHTFIQTRYGVGYKLEAVPKGDG
jgi:DNA-binding response OmpR family regulator